MCRLDLGEELGCTFRIAIVAIRVKLEGFPAICFLDSNLASVPMPPLAHRDSLLVCCLTFYAEQFVVVDFRLPFDLWRSTIRGLTLAHG